MAAAVEVAMQHAKILSCPNETLIMIFMNLARQDLVAVRRCCHQLSIVASPILFKTVSTSFDRLHQLLLLSHSSLAQFVESITFNEICYSLVPAARNPWPYNNCNEMETLVHAIRGHYRLPKVTLTTGQHELTDDLRLIGEPGDTSTPRFEPEGSDDLLRMLISSVLQVYKCRDDFQSSPEAFFSMLKALEGLPNVNLIDVRNERDNGMLKNLEGCQELNRLNQYFPVHEGTIHMIFKYGNNPPQKAFLMIIMVLSTLKRNMGLTVRHSEGLMQMGVPLIPAKDVEETSPLRSLATNLSNSENPWPPEVDVTAGFQYLTKLSIDIALQMDTVLSDQAPIAGSFLQKGLIRAAELEELNIGGELAPNNPDFRFPKFFPMLDDQIEMVPKYPNLRKLTVRRFTMSLPEQLSGILKSQTPSLRFLSFVDCKLLMRTWKDVLQELSDNGAFTLDEFRLENSQCREDEDKEALTSRLLGDRFRWYDRSLIPSEIAATTLTAFINAPSSETPLSRRKWHFCEQVCHEADDLVSELSTNGVLYGVDDEDCDHIDAWETAEQTSLGKEAVDELDLGRDFEDEDTDGPEFDANYDFSAEESSDDEMDIDVDRVRIQGVEMDLETSIHIHRNKRERGLLPLTPKPYVPEDREEEVDLPML